MRHINFFSGGRGLGALGGGQKVGVETVYVLFPSPMNHGQPLDDRQITHLICVRLRHLLYDFLGGVLRLLPLVLLYKRPKTPPKKSHIANVLRGHRLDE